MNHIVMIFPWNYSVIIVLPLHLGHVFRVKHIVKDVVEVHKSGAPCFIASIPATYVLSTIALHDESNIK